MRMIRARLVRACAPPLETLWTPLTDEQFCLFHSSDRLLYSRLTLSLRRDPFVSMRVVAFWMLVERECHDTKFMRRILLLTPEELNVIADETVTCLGCVDCENGYSLGNREISLLPSLLCYWSGWIFSAQSLHERRVGILRGIDRMINNICIRAFKDIMQVLDVNAAMLAAAAEARRTSLEEGWDVQESRTQTVLGTSS